jgi:hypothetical protein
MKNNNNVFGTNVFGTSGLKDIPYTTATSHELNNGQDQISSSNTSCIIKLIRWTVVILTSAGLGMAMSFFINISLIEISINEFFRIYFGVLLIVLGLILLYRGAKSSGTIMNSPRKISSIVLCLSVIASGIVSILFQSDWLLKSHGMFKVFLYGWMATSLTFVILITTLDVISLIHDLSLRFAWGTKSKAPPLFSSPAQVVLVVFVSVTLGLAYGIVFGLVNVGYGVQNVEQLVAQLRSDEYIALPLGCVIGIMGGVANEMLRIAQVSSNSLEDNRSEYDKMYDGGE